MVYNTTMSTKTPQETKSSENSSHKDKEIATLQEIKKYLKNKDIESALQCIKEKLDILSSKVEEIPVPGWTLSQYGSPRFRLGFDQILGDGSIQRRLTKTSGDNWNTIIGDTKFKSGIHYWEWETSNVANRNFMFGIVDASLFSIKKSPSTTPFAELQTHIGDSVLGQASVGLYLSNNSTIFADIYSPIEQTPIPVSGTTVFGLLLNLIEGKLYLYQGTHGSMRRTHLLCSGLRGKYWYPAATLNHDGNFVSLITNCAIPPQ